MAQSQKVSIIGCGTIGRSWALLFLSHGYDVCLFDQSANQLHDAKAYILERIREDGTARSDVSVDYAHESLEISDSLTSCLLNTCYVQECVPEDIGLKQSIFQSIERILLDEIDEKSQKSTVILASSTSTLSPTKMSENWRLKNRFLVAHPINPPHVLTAVEIIAAPWTDKDAVDKTRQIMVELGRTPLMVKKDFPGFIINRLQYALIAECWRMIHDDVADIEDIEKAMTEGLGPRYSLMGVLETVHLNSLGVVNYANHFNDVYLAVRNATTLPALSLKEPKVLSKVRQYFESKAPADQLPQRCQRRDKYLKLLTQLKKKIE